MFCPYDAGDNFDGCRSSNCMMWRWSTMPDPEFKYHPLVPGTIPKQVKTDKGYCGLAGS